MKPVRVSPMEGVLNFLATGLTGPLEQITNKLHNDTVIIDTCLPTDTHIWETGIERINIEGKWIIVEQYEDKKKAEIGHGKWVNLLTEYPDYPLKDIDSWSLDSLRGEEY